MCAKFGYSYPGRVHNLCLVECFRNRFGCIHGFTPFSFVFRRQFQSIWTALYVCRKPMCAAYTNKNPFALALNPPKTLHIRFYRIQTNKPADAPASIASIRIRIPVNAAATAARHVPLSPIQQSVSLRFGRIRYVLCLCSNMLVGWEKIVLRPSPTWIPHMHTDAQMACLVDFFRHRILCWVFIPIAGQHKLLRRVFLPDIYRIWCIW